VKRFGRGLSSGDWYLVTGSFLCSKHCSGTPPLPPQRNQPTFLPKLQKTTTETEEFAENSAIFGIRNENLMSSLTIDSHFADKPPQVRATYDRLLTELRKFGPVQESPKQTSIHLEKNSGFAGVHPRKICFNLEFRTDYKIDDPRITRTQQLSARRFEHTVKLEQESDIDAQLLHWLKDAYELSK
jgi:Domain of unknown function (DUF5655)